MFYHPHGHSPKWEESDVFALREFLRSSTGRKLFPWLQSRRPPAGGDTLEESALRAKLVQGYEQALEDLFHSAFSQDSSAEQELLSAYPSLEDDSLWDGPAINSNPAPKS